MADPHRRLSPPEAEPHAMSSHTERIPLGSSEGSEGPNIHPTSSNPAVPDKGQKSLDKKSSGQKHSGFSRVVQNLLKKKRRSSKSATTGAASSGRRERRSPEEPFASSPLRISSTVMPSAPSSPERPKADTDDTHDTPRRSLDAIDSEKHHQVSTEAVTEKDDDNKSEVALERAAKRQSRDKVQGKRGMAAMMSGWESKLFHRSSSRGRDASGNSSRRGSSLDSKPISSSQQRRSPSIHSPHPGRKVTFSDEHATELKRKMADDVYHSDDDLPKRSSRLPDYVNPAHDEETGVRLAKDVFDRDKNILESSDEETDKSFSDDDNVGLGQWRAPKKKGVEVSVLMPGDFASSSGDKSSTGNITSRDTEKNKKPRKSALKSVVHPQTSFDIPTPRTQSAAGTPYGSEDEAEKEDIHRAQQLSIVMSDIDNRVPNRSIRTIVRDQFTTMQEEADVGRRHQRKFLVALDLSAESDYALEWAIGGVLRDGDTLYAMYAIHEDGNTQSVQVGEGAKAMKDANAVVGTQTKEVSQGHHHAASRNLFGRLGPAAAGKLSSTESRASSAAEAERVKAVEIITKDCLHLLRKTLLQVRIVVEVIHCKSPKLLVTEAIDELEPTMAIVGARGQSALKGVLLGSFSNYLLSNSSVPVMVARRKLQRSQSGSRASKIRLSNNLKTPKSLIDAKVE